jgi:hypothetical protein
MFFLFASWEPTAFVAESEPFFFDRGGKVEDERFDRSLNEMAYALLYPPSSALWSAALQDFWYATRLSEGDVVHYLFITTDYFFSHRDAMRQCARLKTFREPRAQLLAAANKLYFRWWNPPFRFACGVLSACSSLRWQPLSTHGSKWAMGK